MMSAYNESSMPITHMISDSHTLDAIYKWLDNWCNSQNNATPNEDIVDDASALIGAVEKSFTKFKSTAEYVN